MTDVTPGRPSGSATLRRTTAALAAVAALLAAAGCDTSSADGPAEPATIRLYGADGNMSNGFGAVLKDQPGLLHGMKGTTPLTPVTEDFKRRLRVVDPQLVDFIYAGEAYDAVVVAALAAETARSTDGAQIAKYITAVTIARGSAGTLCNSVKLCLDGIRGGKDVAYRGMSIRRAGFTDRGEPSTASYGTLAFSRDNRLDDGKTEFVGAGDERTEARELPPAPPVGGRPRTPPLKIGALLPKTGELAINGPPMFAGAQLAVREINEAGGVLGAPVQWIDGDDGTDAAVASVTVDKHIAAGVQVMIGGGSSRVTKAMVPKVAAAGRVLISPSATSDELTTIEDKGLFFRTAPPDVLQAKALADVIMRYGAQRVVVIGVDDPYGAGLRNNVAEELKAAGVKAERIKTMGYPEEPQPEHFTDLAALTSDFAPDAVLVIGFKESANMIKALSTRGVKFRD